MTNRYDNRYDWRARHNDAAYAPNSGPEAAIVHLINALAEYGEAHWDAHGETLDGPDSFLTPAFGEAIAGVRALLNGDVGNRLDCGLLDSELCAIAERAYFDLDNHKVDYDRYREEV